MHLGMSRVKDLGLVYRSKEMFEPGMMKVLATFCSADEKSMLMAVPTNGCSDAELEHLLSVICEVGGDEDPGIATMSNGCSFEI